MQSIFLFHKLCSEESIHINDLLTYDKEMLKEYYNLDYETKGRAAHNGLYARARRSAIEIIELKRHII